jgi:hypothetical protein
LVKRRRVPPWLLGGRWRSPHHERCGEPSEADHRPGQGWRRGFDLCNDDPASWTRTVSSLRHARSDSHLGGPSRGPRSTRWVVPLYTHCTGVPGSTVPEYAGAAGGTELVAGREEYRRGWSLLAERPSIICATTGCDHEKERRLLRGLLGRGSLDNPSGCFGGSVGHGSGGCCAFRGGGSNQASHWVTDLAAARRPRSSTAGQHGSRQSL